ncbi:MAG: ABC transporter permease subunit [Methylocella sp.]
MLDTLYCMACGYSAAAIVGIVIGVLMARVDILYALLELFVEFWRPIPSVIFIPVFILYAGLGHPMNILVIAITATEAVVLNAFSGARSVSPVLLSTTATFRLSWWQTLREIILPAAAPQIFVGLRLALAKSLVIAVAAGMVAGDAGVGYYVISAQQTLDIPKMYAGAISIAVIGYIFNAAFVLTERVALHWDVGRDRNAAASRRRADP